MDRAYWIRTLTNPDTVIDGEQGPMVPLSLDEAREIAHLLERDDD